MRLLGMGHAAQNPQDAPLVTVYVPAIGQQVANDSRSGIAVRTLSFLCGQLLIDVIDGALQLFEV